LKINVKLYICLMKYYVIMTHSLLNKAPHREVVWAVELYLHGFLAVIITNLKVSVLAFP